MLPNIKPNNTTYDLPVFPYRNLLFFYKNKNTQNRLRQTNEQQKTRGLFFRVIPSFAVVAQAIKQTNKQNNKTTLQQNNQQTTKTKARSTGTTFLLFWGQQTNNSNKQKKTNNNAFCFRTSNHNNTTYDLHGFPFQNAIIVWPARFSFSEGYHSVFLSLPFFSFQALNNNNNTDNKNIKTQEKSNSKTTNKKNNQNNQLKQAKQKRKKKQKQPAKDTTKTIN